MLKKLLKYDFQSVMKYWWIAAISSLALSFVGGGCVSLLTREKELPDLVYPFIIFALILVVLSFVVFYLMTFIFVFVRFYRNFFTDEGYLTFTLPVKRSQLLNSKLIMSVVMLFITFLVYLLEILIVVCIGFFDEIVAPEFWQELSKGIELLWDSFGGYLIIYVLEFLILFILALVFSTLFLFCCITFASIITKKAKVLVAIGIYYVANSIFSFVVQMFYLFAIPSLSSKIFALNMEAGVPALALVLFGIICFVSIFCALLYTLQYWMMDRKLNLS